MTTVRASDLQSRLAAQARDAALAADKNGSRYLTKSERATVAAAVRDEVDAFAASARTVSLSRFVDAFAASTKQAIARADLNGDGFLTDAELARLPANLKNNVAALLGATPAPSPAPTTTPSGAAVFGIAGAVPAAKVRLTPILEQGLNRPTGVAFNPHTGELWVVNRGDDSSVVVSNPGTARQQATKYRDDSDHFMNNPMALAFSPSRNEVATIQESDNDYNGHAAHGNMFMGPTLFDADRRIYNGGAECHLDMLHHSPDSVGIVAGADASKREYWVFNGDAGSLDRYFFNRPHEHNGTDHSDGETYRYAAGSLKKVAGVPAGMALDAATGALYVADTGHGRIVKLDTNARGSARQLSGYHDETPLYGVSGPAVSTVASGVGAPSGLVLYEDKLVVADYATGAVKVFSKTGALEGTLDTGLGANALTGLTAGPDGKLYLLDSKRGKLLRLDGVA